MNLTREEIVVVIDPETGNQSDFAYHVSTSIYSHKEYAGQQVTNAMQRLKERRRVNNDTSSTRG